MKPQFLCLLVLCISLYCDVSGAPKDKDKDKKDKATTDKPDSAEKTSAEATEEPPGDQTEKPEENGVTKRPVIALGVDTSNKLEKWSEAAKNAVKRPTEIVKDSVNILKDGLKMGTDLGEATVAKGIAHLGKQGIVTATDLGKMGIKMGTTLANNTLGVIHKISDMMPVGGRLVKGGVNLGRKGLNAAKILGENLLYNILWWADSGFGWLTNTASTSKSFLHNKTDNLISSINDGIDNGAGKIGDIIKAGISKLPIFRVNASLTLG